MRYLLLAASLLCGLPALAQTAQVTTLSAANAPALLKPPARGERILALWALDCRYCEANMHALAKLQRSHPKEIALVTVATDPIASRAQIDARLRAIGMTGYPAFAYADAAPERMNYLIDPQWGGETPHTLVIHANGKRWSASGQVAAKQIEQIEPH